MDENCGTASSFFDPHAHPRRLNLGCGFDYRDGFLNIDLNDFHKPDLVADIRNLHSLPSDFYEEVVANDVLEHLERAETLSTLIEWSRVLRIGGILRLRVPDLKGLLTLVADPSRQSVEEQERLVQCLFGTQNYTGDYHYTGFTEVLLRHYLEKAGFSDVILQPRDEWLFDAQATKARMAISVAPKSPAPFPEAEYRVAWIAAHGETTVDAGSASEWSVTLKNAGHAVWPVDEVFLSYHWMDGRRMISWDGKRTAFSAAVAPGEEVVLSANVQAPTDGGDLTVVFDLVHEGVTWFEQKGATTLEVAIRVRPAPPPANARDTPETQAPSAATREDAAGGQGVP